MDEREADRPLAYLAEVEKTIQPPEPPEPEEETAADRLRAFEDEHGHVRHGDTIERGAGSKFQSDTDEWGQKHRAHHAALEALVVAEKEHQEIEAAELIAHAKLETAIARAAETEEAL